MSNDGLHRLERFFEQAARRLGGAGLHPVELLRKVQAALEGSVSGGLVGNDITVTFHPEDYGSYRSGLRALENELLGLLTEMEERDRLRRIGDARIRFEQSARVPAGDPEVSVRYADTAVAPETRRGPTERIMRHQGAELIVGGERVPLTHTPFSIGRGVGNDLVLADLSVSRRHAEVVWTAGRFEMVDAGSRNGLQTQGRRVERLTLSPGVHVRLGEVEIWLEERDGHQ